MVHPRLRRAVWLTSPQRDTLRMVAELAATDPSHRKEIEAVLAELARVEARATRLRDLVRATVRGLRLPPDALPVYLSDAQADALLAVADLDIEIVLAIRPEPRIHDANYEEEGG